MSSINPNPPNIRRIQRLWERMNALYGSRWIVEYGEATRGGEFAPLAAVWAEALTDLSNADIAAGLQKCLDRESPHPPTLPEFLRLCGRSPSMSPTAQLAYHAAETLSPNAYADSPAQRCARLAEALAAQAETELKPRLASLLPSDHKQATSTYWFSKIAAITTGKTGQGVMPDGWRAIAGLPEPSLRERGPNAIPTVVECLANAYRAVSA